MGPYVLAVICVSLISGTLLRLTQDGAVKAVMKLLCGIFLALTMIRPLVGLDWESELAELLPDSPASLVAEGDRMARASQAEIIKARSEAYILDKATSLHCPLRADVILSRDDNPIPVAAVLAGKVSPYAKGQLELILQKDLGIPKENLQWTG